MLGDLLKREQLCRPKPGMAFAAATVPQRLDDVPEGVERHPHVGRPGHESAVRAPPPDATGDWSFESHVDTVDYMGLHIS